MSAAGGTDGVMKDSLTGCVECLGALDHCHGTLVVHSHGAVECTDDACVLLHAVRHTLVVDCSAVAGGCMCVEVTEQLRAS